MRFARSLCFTLSFATVGCHTFQPIGVTELTRDMEVRARISQGEADRLSEYLPNEGDRLIDGTFIERSEADLLLLVPVTTANTRGRRETLSQRVQIPFQEIVELERKELDRFKTGLLSAAGGILTGFILYETLLDGSSGNTPGPGGGGPDDLLFSFSLPIGW